MGAVESESDSEVGRVRTLEDAEYDGALAAAGEVLGD